MSVSLADFAAAPGLPAQAAPVAPVGNGSPVGPVIAHEDDADLLPGWVRAFEEAETGSVEPRHMADKCRDYYDGRQFTADEIAQLNRRRQPPTVNNKIKPKVQLLLGLERKGRSDPKAYPRTPVEDMRADAATQALRYISDQNRFDVVRSSAYENMIIEGVGCCEVIVQPVQTRQQAMGSTSMTPTDYDVVINHIPFERLFFDPHSRHPGFSDAQYLGVVIWMDRAEAIRTYPGCEDVLESSFSTTGSSDSYDDRPQVVWTDARRRRVRVVQMWQKRGDTWWHGTLTKAGFLDGPAESPYLDRHDNPTCPLIFRSCFTDRDNRRYGVVRDFIPIQDAINKRESKLLHALNVNQLIMEEGAVADVDKARQEAAKPDGVLVKNRGFELEVRKDQAEISGHFQLLQYSVGQMNGLGPNANMQGKDPRDQSGRAIIAQQTGGVVENEPVADMLRQWTHKVWEAAWDRVRQFWTAERWIRVTDNDKNVKFVGLNRQVTLQDLLNNLDPSVPPQQQISGLPPDEQRAVMFGLHLQPGDPRLGMTVKVMNDISDMDVDITVEEGPDNPTMEAEQFQTLTQLPPQVIAGIPPQVWIEASSLRNKDKLIKLIEENQANQAKQQQIKQATEQAMADATVADKKAQAADRQATAASKIHDMAMDHAGAAHTPVVPGVGAVQPDQNPLLQAAQAQAVPQMQPQGAM